MMYLKSCPRCRGDVVLDEDKFGPFLECLQCGFLINSRREEQASAAEVHSDPKVA